MRKRLYKSKDKRIFKSTANKTKSLNIVSPYIMRGGTRL